MTKSPKKLSRSPHPLDLEDARGDVLADVLGTMLLRNALYKRLEARAPWGLRVPATHGRAMFYLIARGAALLEVEGERPSTLSAGDVAFIAHGTAHTIRDSPTTRSVLVCDGRVRFDAKPDKVGGHGPCTTLVTGFFELGRARVPVLLEGLPRLLMLSPTDPTIGPWTTATIQLILAESANPGPAGALVLQRLVDVLFVQALRSVARRTECKQRGIGALADPPLHEALALMHARVSENWTVARLAAKVGLSRSAFAARFTDLVGEPPLQYLARWRMARAAELLRNTDDGLGQIATTVGYRSVPSFSRAFKQWQGASPGVFRKEPSMT